MFVEEVLHYQYVRCRALGGENPKDARSWNEPPIVAAFNQRGLDSKITHMCCWGKKRPDTGKFILKPRVRES